MGKHISEDIAIDAYENGIKIGKIDPSRETKGLWWEVFKTNDGIIACIVNEDGVISGEKITEDELLLYVDDLKTAKELLLTERV